MTPKERLKEIEEWHFLKETIEQVGPQSHFDMNWLINRVKRLTEALEYQANNVVRDPGACVCCQESAKECRKALEEE